MNHKVNSFGMEWIIGKGKPLLRKEAVWLVLISLAVVLVAATFLALTSAVRPEVLSRVAAGIDASSARWAALGATYAPDYEAIATVNSARWAALGEWYANKIATGD